MKRKHRKAVDIHKTTGVVEEDFFENTTLIKYNELAYEKITNEKIENLFFHTDSKSVFWLNTYGINFNDAFKKIIIQNSIDEFTINLLAEHNHRNKGIELSNCFFFTLKSLFFKENLHEIQTEQLIFIIGKRYVWSIQEKKGDHFEHIRKRLSENLGVVRKKNVDYLFYLIIEAIVDNYNIAYESITENLTVLKAFDTVKANPEFAKDVEQARGGLLLIKKAAISLKEALVQLEKIDGNYINQKYINELREQCNFICDDIDFNLQQLESSINLIFSIQNHRLNEVMKTLTIFSVVFIPLTFLVGIYGMNFKHMPELELKYGYFTLLAAMFIIATLLYFYFRKKKWFD